MVVSRKTLNEGSFAVSQASMSYLLLGSSSELRNSSALYFTRILNVVIEIASFFLTSSVLSGDWFRPLKTRYYFTQKRPSYL